MVLIFTQIAQSTKICGTRRSGADPVRDPHSSELAPLFAHSSRMLASYPLTANYTDAVYANPLPFNAGLASYVVPGANIYEHAVIFA